MGVGDLVVPVDGEEYLFMSEDSWDNEGSWFDPVEIDWDDGEYGLILEIEEFEPEREYKRVKLVVSGVVGWTYSDYLEVV